MKSVVRSGILLGVTLGTAAVLAGPGVAGAAPVKAKTSQRLSLECEKLGSIDVVRNGKGIWSAGHIVGSTRNVKPYEIHLTGTFTPKSGSPQPIDEHHVKPAPASKKLDACTFHDEFTDKSGTASVDGAVKVKYSGKRLP